MSKETETDRHNTRAEASATDDVLPLGEVSLRLRRVLGLRKKSAMGRHRLLGLLRSGELTAFVFLPGHGKLKAVVPTHYWMGIDTNDFRSIAYREGSGKGGAYSLLLSDIPDAVTDALREQARISKTFLSDTLFSEIGTLLVSADEEREAYVRESSLVNWFRKGGHDISDHVADDSRRPGRPEANWLAVHEILASLLVECVQQGRLATARQLASRIVEEAKKLHIERFPAEKTIEKKVAKLIRADS
jgi:hypothetical protein